MALIVQKFGGTSVGTVERIEQVADKVKKFREAGNDLVIVLSRELAMLWKSSA